MQQAWQEFSTSEYEPPQMSLQLCRNSRVLRQMLAGYADLAVISGEPSESTRLSLQKAFSQTNELQQIEIGVFAVAVVCHPQLSITSLTTTQLGDICKGKLTNWEELGGNQQPIVLIGQKSGSNSTHILWKRCFPGRPIRSDLVEKQTPSGVIDTVKKTPGAIGFFLYDWQEIKSVRIMKIAQSDARDIQTGEAHELSPATMASRKYPLTDNLVAILHPNSPVKTHQFVDFLRQEAAGRIGRRLKLFTEYHRYEIQSLERLSAAKKGEGETISVCSIPSGLTLLKSLATEYIKSTQVLQLRVITKPSLTALKEPLTTDCNMFLLDQALSKHEEGMLGNEQKSVDGLSNDIIKRELGRIATGIVVHPENTIEDLSLSDLAEIFDGKLTSWPGMEDRLVVFSPPGIHAQLLLDKISVPDPKVRFLQQKDTAAVIEAVSKKPGSLGIVDLSQLPHNEPSVRFVPVFQTSEEKLLETWIGELPPDYPLARTYTLYVSPEASKATKAFARYWTPRRLAKTLAPLGLIVSE